MKEGVSEEGGGERERVRARNVKSYFTTTFVMKIKENIKLLFDLEVLFFWF